MAELPPDIESVEGGLSDPVPAKYERENALEYYRLINRAKLQLHQLVVDAGHRAIRVSLIINGAAVVALLAYLGSASDAQSSGLTSAMLWYAIGAALAAGGTGANYVGLYVSAKLLDFDQQDREWEGVQTRWRRANGLTIAFVFFSILVFVVASVGAYRSFQPGEQDRAVTCHTVSANGSGSGQRPKPGASTATTDTAARIWRACSRAASPESAVVVSSVRFPEGVRRFSKPVLSATQAPVRG